MKILTFLLSIFIVLLLSFWQALAAPPGQPGPPGAHLNIIQVFVDDPNDPTSIIIVGEDLLFGAGPLTVTLGEYVVPLTIIGTPTDIEIVATLPANIDDGDYLLTVANGNGQSQNDEYDLTIGAVGPPGDPGEQGVQGKLGDTGAQGEQGKLGDQGVQGKLGDQGVQGKLGDQGVQGKLGDQGVQGKLGDQGVQGKLGDQGVQGKMGDQGVQGKMGDQGVQGKMGPPGIGMQGDQGVQGKLGDQGVQGKLGDQGVQGKLGPPGPAGGVGNNVVYPMRTNMQPYGVVNYIIALQGQFPSRNSANPLLGEIFMFAGNFAPRGFALCDGQLLAISSYNALFAILGTTYGGDGRTTFGLPDLRGRAPLHAGNGPGLTPRSLGEKGGSETYPEHNHQHAP